MFPYLSCISLGFRDLVPFFWTRGLLAFILVLEAYIPHMFSLHIFIDLYRHIQDKARKISLTNLKNRKGVLQGGTYIYRVSHFKSQQHAMVKDMCSLYTGIPCMGMGVQQLEVGATPCKGMGVQQLMVGATSRVNTTDRNSF